MRSDVAKRLKVIFNFWLAENFESANRNAQNEQSLN